MTTKFYKYYSRKLEQHGRGRQVYDKDYNFIFQFERQYGDKELWDVCSEHWMEFEKSVLNCINNGEILNDKRYHNFSSQGIEIYAENKFTGIKQHVITIRGWGGLTGVGGFNLSDVKAVEIQNSYRDMLVDLLNSKDKEEWRRNFEKHWDIKIKNN